MVTVFSDVLEVPSHGYPIPEMWLHLYKHCVCLGNSIVQYIKSSGRPNEGKEVLRGMQLVVTVRNGYNFGATWGVRVPGGGGGGLWALGYPSRTEEGLTGPRVAPPGKPGIGTPPPPPQPCGWWAGHPPPSAVMHVLLSVLGRRSAAQGGGVKT